MDKHLHCILYLAFDRALVWLMATLTSKLSQVLKFKIYTFLESVFALCTLVDRVQYTGHTWNTSFWKPLMQDF